MVNFDLDSESLHRVMRELRRMSGSSLNAELAKAVNEGGKDLYDHSVYAIAEYFHIPLEAVKYGIDQRMATERNIIHTTKGYSGKIPYVIWHTAGDEYVCKICGPRNGEIYSVADAKEIWPAHPNCRCTLENVPVPGALLASAQDESLRIALETSVTKALEGFTKLFGDIQG